MKPVFSEVNARFYSEKKFDDWTKATLKFLLNQPIFDETQNSAFLTRIWYLSNQLTESPVNYKFYQFRKNSILEKNEYDAIWRSITKYIIRTCTTMSKEFGYFSQFHHAHCPLRMSMQPDEEFCTSIKRSRCIYFQSFFRFSDLKAKIEMVVTGF